MPGLRRHHQHHARVVVHRPRRRSRGPGRSGFGTQIHFAARGCELDGVVGEVLQHLAQPRGVADDPRQRWSRCSSSRRTPFFGRPGSPSQDVLEQPRRVHGFAPELDACPLELRHVEQARDQLEQLLALVADGLDELLCSSFRSPAMPLGQHLRVADDRRERRAQLVAHGGEEVRLEPVELLELVVGLLEPLFFSASSR